MMAKILLSLLFLSSFAHGEAKFEDKKARMIQHLDKKIADFQTAKTCAEGATDKAGLKACRKALKDAHKAHREARKAEKMKRKGDKKAKKAMEAAPAAPEGE